ncbi:MAG TPA: hypothetical protein VFM69_12300 [Pricia sp.]|nr:hypothetical protein [Pricia sp.]
MKTSPVLSAILIVLTLTLTSCGPLIFKANFDAYAVGNAPNPNPPGDPSGDEIKGNCGLTVVNSAVVDSKAMRFYNDTGCSVDLMWFESDNLAASNNFLNYTFSGYPESTSHRNFYLSFAGGHFKEAFSILFDSGTLYLTDGGYNQHDIGNYTANQKQTFLVGIDRDTNTYSVTITREGAANIQLSDRPIKDADFWGQTAYILQAYYDTNDSGSSPNGYVFDSVTMNKEDMD